MAKRLGQELKNIRFEAVYTSDLQRTKETARYILAENKQGYPPIYSDPDLRELSFGRFEEANNFTMVPTALRTLGLRKILRAFANEEHVSELTELFRTMDLPSGRRSECSCRLYSGRWQPVLSMWAGLCGLSRLSQSYA